VKNPNLATKIFQSYIKSKDIREFKNNFFYYCFYRILRKQFNSNLIVKIYNFFLYSSYRKNKTSYSLLQKCDFFDVSEIKIIKKVSKFSKIFLIDCGSNFGFYTFFTSSLSPENYTIAIEASEKTLNEFKENLSLNNFNNIKYINKAVSDEDDKVIEFSESENDWESSTISSHLRVKSSKNIATITIDTILKGEKVSDKKLIIKIDVEGGDINVLAGAQKTIKSYQPIIIIEFSKYIHKNQKYNYDFLEKFLELHNYEIYNFEGETCKVFQIKKKIKELDKSHNTIGNYLLIKKNSKFIKQLFEKNG